MLSAAEEVKQWWDQLTKLVQLHVGSHPPICLGDLNAYFGDCPSPAIGAYGATKENLCGSLARAFCDRFDFHMMTADKVN